MSYGHLKGLKFVTVIPVIEKQNFHSFEVPAITGPVPEGMTPNGFSIAFTYNNLMLQVKFHKIERNLSDDTIMINTRDVTRGQTWDMGGAYFCPIGNQYPPWPRMDNEDL